MSHFYGIMHGSKGEATRCGTKTSGMTIVAASWKGAIEVHLYYDEKTKQDMFCVRQIPWNEQGSGLLLAKGVVGGNCARAGRSE